MQSRFIGRFSVQDGRTIGRTGDYEPPAQKTEVSRFKGEHHAAERDAETGDLVIFSIGNSDGIPGVETYTGDRMPVRTIADLQRVYDATNARDKAAGERQALIR